VIDTIRDGFKDPTGVAHLNDKTWVADSQKVGSSKDSKITNASFQIETVNY
jgi:hypothetical protein